MKDHKGVRLRFIARCGATTKPRNQDGTDILNGRDRFREFLPRLNRNNKPTTVGRVHQWMPNHE